MSWLEVVGAAALVLGALLFLSECREADCQDASDYEACMGYGDARR